MMTDLSNLNEFKTTLKTTKIFYNENLVVFKVFQKSRFVMKNAIKIGEILDDLQIKLGRKFTEKRLIIDGEICSKSKNFLNDWKIEKNDSF